MFKLADAHTHIFPQKIVEKATKNIGAFYDIPMDEMGSSEALLEKGKEAGIQKFLVCSVATKASQVEAINDFIIGECQKHPEFLGFASLNPDYVEVEKEIDRVMNAGLRGIKFHPDFQLCNINDEKLFPTYAILEERGIPALFHMGDNRYTYSAPGRLRKVVERFPKMVCVAAHFGGYRVWDDAYEALKDKENIYFDTSSSLAFISKEKAAELIHHYGAERFMFGTDFPMWTPTEELERFMAIPLTDGEREQIAHRTFEELFQITW